MCNYVQKCGARQWRRKSGEGFEGYCNFAGIFAGLIDLLPVFLLNVKCWLDRRGRKRTLTDHIIPSVPHFYAKKHGTPTHAIVNGSGLLCGDLVISYIKSLPVLVAIDIRL